MGIDTLHFEYEFYGHFRSAKSTTRRCIVPIGIGPQYIFHTFII